jgi:hypothetical protein
MKLLNHKSTRTDAATAKSVEASGHWAGKWSVGHRGSMSSKSTLHRGFQR